MTADQMTADPLQSFEIREAAREIAAAAALSQAEGRAVDHFGFAAKPNQPADAPRIGMRSVMTAKQRLDHARWLRAIKAETATAAAEDCRRAIEEFEIPAERELMTMAELFPELFWMLNGAKTGAKTNKER